MADTGAPIHVRISDVLEKTITNELPATGLRPPGRESIVGVPKADPGQDHKYQQTVAVQVQQYSVATEAIQSSGTRPAEAVPFNAANLSITGARYSAAAVKKLHLLCRGAPAEAAKAVQFNRASQVKVGAQSSAASLAKAVARSSAAAAVVAGRAETAAAAVVHHEEDKFTALNFGGYQGSVHTL